MRIAFLLLHDFRFAGWGIRDFLERQHFSKEFSARLAKENDVTLYVFHQDARSPIECEMGGYTIKIFPVQFRMPPLLTFGNDHNLKLLEELKKDCPDLIHFNNYYLWSFPYVMLWAMKNKIPVVAQYHGACDLMKPIREEFSWIYRNVNAYLVSLDEEAQYLSEGMGVDRRRILKFPNTGVDTHIFRPSGAKSPNPTFAYVGRMTLPSKNFREQSPWLLIPTFSRLAAEYGSIKLKMVGDGPGLHFLKKLARSYGAGEKVEFLGYLPQRELPEIYSQCWATFFPLEMRKLEPLWGGAQKESLACGTPIIGFSKDALGPMPESCGYLIPLSTERAAISMRRIMLEKEDLFKRGEMGKKVIDRCCSWDAVVEMLNQIYSDLVSGARTKQQGERPA